eukprot:CAMPEP_0174934956 /NCGR_PEP_ID=MMETSP1355-20121228/51594_1 /TAXON_ID=464990 /ORGANISM="Hemiselmis tepida, Strain CCMP443" /LENGTH=61 /DNA_ID=CAMNT_0016181601 /DNA_START=88 /DNA_END=269 /DNA_ORIENTATION=-
MTTGMMGLSRSCAYEASLRQLALSLYFRVTQQRITLALDTASAIFSRVSPPMQPSRISIQT